MEKIEKPEMDLMGGETVKTAGGEKVKTGGRSAAAALPAGETKEGSSEVGAGAAKDVIAMIVRLLTSEDDMLAQKMDNNPVKDDV
eukprot:1191017-Prorocentrum_minimum.AAC.4